MRNPLNSELLLQQIAKLHSKDIDLGLDRFAVLLEKLGNPHKELPPVIHVAGTNGKGSTVAFLRAFFETVGYKVHSFTSPHFHHARETITLGGNEIAEDSFSALLEEVIEANNGAPLTVFEAMTACAFLAFSRTHGHVVLLETGMGGLGDTTNIIETPALCILTPISMDHAEFLGDGLGKIARHKAGILKKGVPVIVAKQDDKAYHAIRERAKQLGCLMYREGREWFVKQAGERLVFESWAGDRAYGLPNLQGAHQIQNAGVALAGVQILRNQFNLPDEAIGNAITSVEWRGRLERIANWKGYNDQWEFWLDGGHNEAAAKVLRAQIKKWNDRPLYLIVGMLKRKDSKAFLKQIAGLVDHVYTVPIPEQAAKKPETLAVQTYDVGGTATACQDLPLALDLIRTEQKKPGRVLICGSLTLLAAVYELQPCP